MNDSIVTITLDGGTEEVKPPAPCFWVATKPNKGLVDKLVGEIEGMPVSERPFVVVIDNTPRDSLQEMEDYTYLMEDYYKYRYVVKPFWSDDSATLLRYLESLKQTFQVPLPEWGYSL